MCTATSKRVFCGAAIVGVCTIFSVNAMRPSFSEVAQRVSPTDELKLLHDRVCCCLPDSYNKAVFSFNLVAAISLFESSQPSDEGSKNLVDALCCTVGRGFEVLCNRPGCLPGVQKDAASIMGLLREVMNKKYPPVKQPVMHGRPVLVAPLHIPSPRMNGLSYGPQGSPIGSGPTDSCGSVSPVGSGPSYASARAGAISTQNPACFMAPQPGRSGLPVSISPERPLQQVTSRFFEPFYGASAQQK